MNSLSVFDVVEDEAERRSTMAAFMETLVPGSQAEIRTGSDKEFAVATVMHIALYEAACKVRAGGPEDDEEDMSWPVWTGVLPSSAWR